MDLPFVIAPLAGLATGFAALGALRLPVLAWVALVPLGYLTATASASEAAIAAAVAGALFGV